MNCINTTYSYLSYEDTTTEVMADTMDCKVLPRTVCKPRPVKKCDSITFTTCSKKPVEECHEEMVPSPSKEKIHRQYFLTELLGDVSPASAEGRSHGESVLVEDVDREHVFSWNSFMSEASKSSSPWYLVTKGLRGLSISLVLVHSSFSIFLVMVHLETKVTMTLMRAPTPREGEEGADDGDDLGGTGGHGGG